ncbi:MAG: addiction module protein [Methylacidiphilales bacterium]|nr:addiction module protein [Candidatus Methylacidiphilales bacterium]
MVKAVEKLTKDALSLPPRSRARLASRILDSLEGPKATSLRNLWAQEAENRINAYDAGHIPSIPGELVFKRLRLKNKI